MRLLTTIEQMRAEIREARRREASVGFVPTMGALHDGHMSLVRRSLDENDFTVMSVFLNPAQFDEAADFEAYPRTLDEDVAWAEAEGVDVVFAPDVEEMYGANRDTIVQVDRLARPLCGMSRGRGHFIGVCTVVTKLFNIVQPDRAYFGQKDAQQAIILTKMVADLNMPVDVVVCPIVREPDGLAMSSRNVRIPPELRPSAVRLREALCIAREALRGGERDAQALCTAAAEHMLQDPNVEVDYLNVVSLDTLEDVETVDRVVLVAGAIRVGGTRLIDNILVGPDGPWED